LIRDAVVAEMTDSRALVLSGGGVTGIAWCLGLLYGLQLAEADVTSADLIVGTSAGATVGAQIAGGTPLSVLVELQKGPADSSGEIAVDLDLDTYLTRLGEVLEGVTEPTDIRAKIGSVALETATVPESTRRDVIVSRLPIQSWTDRDLRLVSVDTASGHWRTFDRNTGVPLVDAVAASCAVPGVWPPVTIDGRRYMDGGTRSLTNADVAAGHDRVLVVVLRPMTDQDRTRLNEEMESLGADTATVVIEVDEPSRLAMGPNPLDPQLRGQSVHAGHIQALDVADVVCQFWN
jgi:NTE family protein